MKRLTGGNVRKLRLSWHLTQELNQISSGKNGNYPTAHPRLATPPLPITPPTPFWDTKCCSSFRGNVKLFIVFYFWKVSIGFPSIWLWLRPRNFLFNYQTFDSILKYLLCSTYKCMYVYCVCILIKGSTHSVLAVVVNHFLLSFRACVCVCVCEH